MKESDNIEKFFRKRMLEDDLPVTDWDLPSEDLWNKAKPHFPKEKKRRKPFFWLFFGGLFLILISAFTIAYFNSSEASVMDIDSKVSLSDNTNKSAITTNEKTITPTKIEEIAEIKSNIDQEKEAPKTEKKLPNKTYTIKANDNISQVTITRNETSDLKENSNPKRIVDQKKSGASEKISSAQLTNQEQLAAELKATQKANSLSLVETTLDNNAKLGIPTIASLMWSQLKTEANLMRTPKMSLIKPVRSFKRWEIGVSHSPFLNSPLTSLEEDLEKEDESYTATKRYLNLIVPITGKISKRFSLSSGLSASALDMNLNFLASEVYNADTPNENLKRLIEQSAAAGSLTLNNQDTSFFEIEFLPDANLMNGDTLFLEGFIPLRFKYLELPLIFNTHWQFGRVEFLTHIGVSFRLIEVSIDDLGFDITHEGRRVTRQVNFNSLSSTDFETSLLLGGGFRYHLTEHWNIGFSTKLDIFEPILSRFEIGSYYQF